MSEIQRRQKETDCKMRKVLDWLALRVVQRTLGRKGGRIVVEIFIDNDYVKEARLTDVRNDDMRPEELGQWLDKIRQARSSDGLKGIVRAEIGSQRGSVAEVVTTEVITLSDDLSFHR